MRTTTIQRHPEEVLVSPTATSWTFWEPTNMRRMTTSKSSWKSLVSSFLPKMATVHNEVLCLQQMFHTLAESWLQPVNQSWQSTSLKVVTFASLATTLRSLTTALTSRRERSLRNIFSVANQFGRSFKRRKISGLKLNWQENIQVWHSFERSKRMDFWKLWVNLLLWH